MPRRLPIFEFSNPPLIVAMLAAAIARTTHGSCSHQATQLSRLALLVWSAAEITTGVNWLRRSLGVPGGAYSRATLKRHRVRLPKRPARSHSRLRWA
jgi:hypothetical protein